jgi:integrase
MIVNHHPVPTLGAKNLADLSPSDLRAYLATRVDAGLSPTTARYHHAVLRAALAQGTRDGILARNVAALVRAPRANRFEINPLTAEQARWLLKHVQGDRLEGLYTVALALGLRQGEALGLAWTDVDLVAGTLRVRHALQRVDGRQQLVEPKTSRSRRSLVLPAFVTQALGDHRHRQLEERLNAGPRWQESGLVFTTRVGRPLPGEGVTRNFYKVLRRSGLPPMRFHDLRHSSATLMLARGVSMRVVMETLGHSTITLTMNTYAHVLPALQREAAQRMDAVLGAPKT